MKGLQERTQLLNRTMMKKDNSNLILTEILPSLLIFKSIKKYCQDNASMRLFLTYAFFFQISKLYSTHSEFPWDLDTGPIFNHVDSFVQRCRDMIDVCESMITFGRYNLLLSYLSLQNVVNSFKLSHKNGLRKRKSLPKKLRDLWMKGTHKRMEA